MTHLLPAAVQRGTTSEVNIFAGPGGRGFAGSFWAYVEGVGVTAETLPPAEKQSMHEQHLRLTVAADAPLGLREVRVATDHGPSTVGQLLVTDHVVISEQAEPHGQREQAQQIAVGQIVGGRIAQKEETDYYRFTVGAGQTVICSMISHRFFFKRHSQFDPLDPIINLYDASGREIASNDDFNSADPLLAHTFTQAGEYFLAVRDVDFNGSVHYSYLLQLTDKPFVTAIYPLAFAPQGPRQVTAAGFNLRNETGEALLPQDSPIGPQVVQVATPGGTTNPIPVTVTQLPLQADAEPNNELAQAQSLSIPCAINGRMDQANDLDSFTFTLKAEQAVRFEVRARELGSHLDTTIRLLNESGGDAGMNDDGYRTKDSVLVFKPTADGVFTLQIRDLLYRGGANFPYVVFVTFDEPDFELTCDDEKAGIYPGGAAPWFVRATRRAGFDGPIAVRVEGLPAGVTASPLIIPGTMNDGVLVLQAEATAKNIASAVRVLGSSERKNADGSVTVLEHAAQPLTEYDLPGGSRGVWPVNTALVQVNEQSDLAAVSVSPATISLAPGQQATLDVEIVRCEGFKERVTLDLKLQHLGQIFGDPLPPGVKIVEGSSKLSLGSDETRGKIVLEAATDAKPVENATIAVLGNVSISFVVKRAYCSPPVSLSVMSPAQ